MRAGGWRPRSLRKCRLGPRVARAPPQEGADEAQSGSCPQDGCGAGDPALRQAGVWGGVGSHGRSCGAGQEVRHTCRPHPVCPQTPSCPQTGEVLKFKQGDSLTEQAGQRLQSCEASAGERHLQGSPFQKKRKKSVPLEVKAWLPWESEPTLGPRPAPGTERCSSGGSEQWTLIRGVRVSGCDTLGAKMECFKDDQTGTTRKAPTHLEFDSMGASSLSDFQVWTTILEGERRGQGSLG